MQNSYKLARTCRHVMKCRVALVHISQNSYKYRINSYRIAKVYLYFVMNIVDISFGTRRTVLTKTFVTQLVDICGDMWRVITRANSSHIVGKLVTVGQGLVLIDPKPCVTGTVRGADLLGLNSRIFFPRGQQRLII